MEWFKDFSILVVDDDLRSENTGGRATREIIKELQKRGLSVIESYSGYDCKIEFMSHSNISCILLDWDLVIRSDEEFLGPGEIIEIIRSKNALIPLFLMTEKLRVKEIPLEIVSQIDGYVWKLEDSPSFIAGRIEEAIERYMEELLPPFLKELIHYVDEFKYSWHTPGHSGGEAFLKSPTGKLFHRFFGENVFRSDLSVSVPELGSLLDHTEAIGAAEKFAAKIFGADETYFVTNGTSTSNKIVFHSCVTPGDIVLIDRNCHKSIMHSIIMTGAIPIYLTPSRNSLGIIGPIHEEEFDWAEIEKKINSSSLVSDKENFRIKLAVVTNSTYDGLCYNTRKIIDRLEGVVDYVLFDEAWYAYANFHPMYVGRYGMSPEIDRERAPTVFTTHSTHKLLAAFSQGSMIHVKDGKKKIDHGRFNEAYMMHMSTSPQYAIIASLDVSSKMMAGNSGRFLIDETIQEAIVFRKKMKHLSEEIEDKEIDRKRRWWFEIWQPSQITMENEKGERKREDIEDIDEQLLKDHPEYWCLKGNEDWHGFGKLESDYILLDPIKVTVMTPGITKQGRMRNWGIPATIVTTFLRDRGIVVEKSGHYSFLILFSLGLTKGKSGTLLAELFTFKKLFDENAPLDDVFPDIVKKHPKKYGKMTLQELSEQMHEYLRKARIARVLKDVYSQAPEQVMLPARAYSELVNGNTELVRIRELQNRISAVMVVPYPPGIPVIMPGERYTPETKRIVEYLNFSEDFDNRFPGFENEMHGLKVKLDSNNKKRYYTYCLKETPQEST
ncbi:MAG TPA: Orn/Lys/Arg decarboxylase N-terminal domain-containing protein [Mesotoga sp.]|jgi:arginine decarboxylase|nr:lysine decarboxylase [Mesotoga sp.]NLX33040.1 lysine decarboxylase [Thermotogaceae bacterium]MDD4039859.1 Orn/Lys/Arg decarboxylase N-terminal domain-containing protein [Mesotoga sp.]MDD4479155.1 Orn/Lys/Arg decarboxylase N-terminal domain-containing protein [Mesotoga sp.]MDD5743525.1 Orn/Lys/Arg decarboxylase N-terminal domain-containing protein [Mesotoga sp.]